MHGPVLLTDALAFPPPSWATPEGLLAVGGDLRAERLLVAYSMGIFPWPHKGLPLLWFSPDPRMVLVPSRLHVSRSMQKQMRKGVLRVTLDTAFAQVIEGCATISRAHEKGTWISDDIIGAYCELHELGYAHSAETWIDDTLVGGLYGVSLGNAFFGESMFARATDASKVAFVTLVRQLQRWSFDFVDCQIYTQHLEGLGAEEWPREAFLTKLRTAVAKPSHRGTWSLDPTPG